MDHDGEAAGCTIDLHRLGTSAEQLGRLRKHEFLGDPCDGIMVSTDDEDADTGLVQTPELLGQEAGRLHRGLVAIIEIAGDHQGIDVFVQAQIDDPNESAPRRIADQLRQLGIAQCERAEWGVQMNVRCVDEAVHALPPLRAQSADNSVDFDVLLGPQWYF